MTVAEREEIQTAVANISSHLGEFPLPTPMEKELLKTIDFLCMAIMKIIEAK